VSSNNLPLLLTSFIGREFEVGEARNLLHSTHLLTLTGAGGSGKTRLALAVAGKYLDQFPGGVWWVDLASLGDAAFIPQAIAAAVGVHEISGTPLAETLAAHLKPRQVLLVLDNCEHLIEACARLVYTLLVTCPGLRILATSREPLHIAGEVTWLVPALSLPDLQRLASPQELARSEAVSLFIDRARSLLPDFTLDERNAAAIAQICRRLGGVPLAIELAAARIRVLTPEQIAARLDDVFHLLVSSDRSAPTRHQTLQAALDWSYDLLAAEEQVLFRRLAVFAGGFSLDAAEEICAEDGAAAPPLRQDTWLRQDRVLDLLAQLVDKSLVGVDAEAGRDRRYRFLEPVRQYSVKRLQDSGEAVRIRDRHLAWYLSLAERAAPEMFRVQQTVWAERWELETPNLRAALDWSLAQGRRAHLGARLAVALTQFWQLRGYFSEGMEWLEMVLSKSAELPERERVEIFFSAAFLAVHVWDTARAKRYLAQSLELWQALGDREGIARQTRLSAWVAAQDGEIEAALRLGEESLALHREIEDAWGVVSALLLLGDLAYLRGDIPGARAIQEESLALSRQHGYSLAVARRLTRLGQIASALGESEQARAFFDESLRLGREGGDQWGMAMALGGMGGLARRQAQPARAASLLGATQAFLDAFGAPLWVLDRIEFDENLAAVKASLGEKEFAAAWDQGAALRVGDLDRVVQFALALPGPSPAESRPGEPSPTPLQAARQEFSGLTRREREVAALVARGMSNSEIAAALFVGLRTAEAHVTHILSKLGFSSRTQIAGWAVDRGLASPPQAQALHHSKGSRQQYQP
jgi:predicted ATPase/DNA-binding CsgD family transcriptional regulator